VFELAPEGQIAKRLLLLVEEPLAKRRASQEEVHPKR
jgi:hypothetical protein